MRPPSPLKAPPTSHELSPSSDPVSVFLYETLLHSHMTSRRGQHAEYVFCEQDLLQLQMQIPDISTRLFHLETF